MYYFESITDFKALLGSVFTSNELLRVGYESICLADLKAILGRSEGFIDGLRYKGRFVEDYQPHAFPRKLNTGYVVEKNDERVLKAVCCVAFDYMQAMAFYNSEVEQTIRSGIKSISTGGVSESYGSIDDFRQGQEVSQNYVKYLGFCLFKNVL